MPYHETTIVADYPLPIIFGDDGTIAKEVYDGLCRFTRAEASVKLMQAINDGISYSVCWREEMRAPPADRADDIHAIFVVTVVVSANVDQCL